MRGSLVYDGPLSWSPLARLRRFVCPTACASTTHEFTLGQAIYTGDTEHPQRLYRPNAGWLFVDASERDSTASSVQEIGLAVGVVGPPALGEPMQRLFHALGPDYQRPIDWHRQIPFEPGFVARLTRITTLQQVGSLAISSRVGGALGTILTSATAGLGASGGIKLAGASASRWWPRLELGADAIGHGVLRDEFLDGAFFRSSDHMSKNSFYDEERLSLGLRWARIAVRYRATRTGKQYSLQPGPAEWASFDVEWRPR